jgi:ABC-type uncharacterized transport system permease subunit
MDRLLLILAMLCLLGSFGYTLYALGAGRIRPGRSNFVGILGAFAALTGFLYLRGQAEGSCPLNSLYDVLIFQGWALLLIYLVIGSAYRLSLLGAFTAPLGFFLIFIAEVAPLDQSLRMRAANGWIEFHAASAIISYGAFGLAAVAGVMYLLQERLLKSHKASSLLFNLPPINDLSKAIGRLVVLGFSLLTLGFAAGFVIQMPVNTLKFAASVGIWALYGLVIVLRRTQSLSPKRLAEFAIGVFLIALVTLPGIQYLSSRP